MTAPFIRKICLATVLATALTKTFSHKYSVSGEIHFPVYKEAHIMATICVPQKILAENKKWRVL